MKKKDIEELAAHMANIQVAAADAANAMSELAGEIRAMHMIVYF